MKTVEQAWKEHGVDDDMPVPEHFADGWDAAMAELEALRRDAERYLWLRDIFSPMGLNIDGNHAWMFRWNGMLKGPNLDAAIDAAMKT